MSEVLPCCRLHTNEPVKGLPFIYKSVSGVDSRGRGRSTRRRLCAPLWGGGGRWGWGRTYKHPRSDPPKAGEMFQNLTTKVAGISW